ncbi:MAG: YicC family protein [Oscillospiraceae bacterium]|nr:YicC family protein [Oscillospiraceae bacterium]
MIKSMTGYGCASGEADKLGVKIELRSVNNRYLDCGIRIPRVYTALEDPMKALIQKSVTRGKVDVYVTIDSSGTDDTNISVNRALAEAYLQAVTEISETFELENDLTALSLARMPDVLTVEKAEADTDILSEGMCAILSAALEDYNAMREAEGKKLYADISSRLDTIISLVQKVERRSPQTVKEYREKLSAKMAEVLGGTGIDENRILMEAAIYADKVAVDEETVRLRSHIDQMRDMIQSSVPVGRKLDFLVQEMNREANTIGSKCSDIEISRAVVDIKGEIEKIREQVQNIE